MTKKEVAIYRLKSVIEVINKLIVSLNLDDVWRSLQKKRIHLAKSRFKNKMQVRLLADNKTIFVEFLCANL